MADIRSYADYLARVRIPIRLSCRTESGWPFVLSLWFIYRDGFIYCATQDDARIVKYLENEPRCGFEIAGDLPPYCGIRGQARARVDREQGAEILEGLLIRYLNGVENPLAKKLLAQADREVALVLDPVNCFSWDFTQRMESVLPDMLGLVNKVCP
jgi:nitroimidazol reductase NimA-like FMN-containing flavoprotein (pyridoxamine 5'-phosphate oxidase superfamily)